MVLGEKLFEESGNVTGIKITRVHPIEGLTMEASFTSEISRYGVRESTITSSVAGT